MLTHYIGLVYYKMSAKKVLFVVKRRNTETRVSKSRYSNNTDVLHVPWTGVDRLSHGLTDEA